MVNTGNLLDEFYLTLGLWFSTGKLLLDAIGDFFSGRQTTPSGGVQFYAAGVAATAQSTPAVVPYRGTDVNEYNKFLSSLLNSSYRTISGAAEALSKVGDNNTPKIIYLITSPDVAHTENIITLTRGTTLTALPTLSGKDRDGNPVSFTFGNKILTSQVILAEEGNIAGLNISNNGGPLIISADGLTRTTLSDTIFQRGNTTDGSSQESIFNINNSSIYADMSVFRYRVYGNVNERAINSIFNINNSSNRYLVFNQCLIEYHYAANNYVGTNTIFNINNSAVFSLNLNGSQVSALINTPEPSKSITFYRGTNATLIFKDFAGKFTVGAPNRTSASAVLAKRPVLDYTLFVSTDGTVDAEFIDTAFEINEIDLSFKSTNNVKDNKVSYNAVYIDETTKSLLDDAFKYAVSLDKGSILSNGGVAVASKHIDNNYKATVSDYKLYVINRRGITIILPVPSRPGQSYRIIKAKAEDNVTVRAENSEIEGNKIFTIPKSVKSIKFEAFSDKHGSSYKSGEYGSSWHWEITDWSSFLPLE